MKKQITDPVTTSNGRVISIQGMIESLHNYPSYARKEMSTDGTTGLSNCVYKEPTCGCKIAGNGTLQFPLEVKFCNKHQALC